MKKSSLLPYLCGSGLLLAIGACAPEASTSETASDSSAATSSAESALSGGNPEVRASDDCDPATFGTLCDPAFNGGTTRDEFTAELTKTQKVGKWKYSSPVNVNSGRNVVLTSRGGETHTFTVVARYGGGVVPTLNTLSGNPVPAPECLAAAGPTNVSVAAGSTQVVTAGPGKTLPPGKYKVQCCIHPWMRTEVDVR
jgi:hypothetical protein